MSPQTLARPSRFLLEVKKSRHLAQATTVDSAESAMAFIAAASDRAATHNAWAYRVGQAYRFHDDGEPSGTAGRPILAAIDGQGLDHVAVVVTRWFGGIKLGAGGLVRAYGGAAAECLRQAERRPLLPFATLNVHAPFDLQSTTHAAFAAHGAERLSEAFDADGARYRVRLPASGVEALVRRLRDGGRGRITVMAS